MTSKSDIRKQIESTVGGRYRDWQIGVTEDPLVRKAQLGNPLTWLQWQADSEESAGEIRDEFVNKGMMLSGRSGPPSGDYVYTFTT